MRRLAIVLSIISASPGLSAQDSSRTLERVNLALQQPRTIVSGAAAGDALRSTERGLPGIPVLEPLADAPTIGPFTFAAPQMRGEFVRLALPVGEYLSNGIRKIAAANRRRQEAAARRQVEAEVQAWKDHSPKP